ncbi:unnamed protein product [Closterium sp. Yama58-4]|nr:unnamed protein product [Closterium sp. Yama58-4]
MDLLPEVWYEQASSIEDSLAEIPEGRKPQARAQMHPWKLAWETGAATGAVGNSGEGAGAGGGGQAEDPRGGLSEAEWMALAEQLRGEGDALLKEAAEAYERRKESSSDARWLAAVRRSGTAADRVAALTVVIQDDPVANLANLDALLGKSLLKYAL